VKNKHEKQQKIPPHLAPKKGDLVMFENPLLERLSRISPWTVLIIFTPVLFISFWYSLNSGISIGLTILLFLSGLVLWTLFEYLMHRFIFHFYPNGPFQTRLQFTMHGVHHQYPNDKDRLVMPVSVSIPIAVLMYLLFHSVLAEDAFGFFSGFLCGYLAYDMIHYSIHHWHNMKNPVMSKIRRHHMAHHFRDTNRGFGVSTPPWDYIFRT
jgi:4-hydroxysphinganine ceramide fatty acyl 2-hydroxylase